MSKAILVMDMPINCRSCPLSTQLKEYYLCKATGHCVFPGPTCPPKEICPLRECPKKIKNTLYGELMFHKEAVEGWNACVDEILCEVTDNVKYN